jgi:osmoprotectant transport system ATP-binding protein
VSHSPNTIALHNVSKYYNDVAAVKHVSMTIAPAQITVIVGTSGSGKSTLLRMMNRLVPMSEGQITLNGADINQQSPTQLRRQMGYAIQGNGLFPHRTVAQNIGTVPQLLGWPRARIHARVEELLELFDLPPAQYAHKMPHELSGGQQQRVGVARALAAEPEILLMDEPFGALDPVIRAKAQMDLLKIQRQLGVTIVLVTHDMDEAFLLGNTIAIMHQGALRQYATAHTILTQPADDFCRQLTSTNDRALKLLALSQIASHMRPVTHGLAHSISGTRTLREALSEMLWHHQDALAVTDAHGQTIGAITLEQVRSLATVSHNQVQP